MTDYDNSNTGALFRNDKKETEKHPDYTGSGEITCPHCGKSFEFWISAWIKIAKKTAQKFFSFAFKPKDQPAARPPAPPPADEFDDDLPF